MKINFLMSILLVAYLRGVGVAEAELLLFGGSGHDEFLGCVDCNEYSSESICNEYGKFGNDYSSDSIWNEYSAFGNEYVSQSPWNEYSTSKSVPVLVDKQGKFYGYFTINSYRSDSVDFSDELGKLYESLSGDLEDIREAFCDAF